MIEGNRSRTDESEAEVTPPGAKAGHLYHVYIHLAYTQGWEAAGSYRNRLLAVFTNRHKLYCPQCGGFILYLDGPPFPNPIWRKGASWVISWSM